MAKWALSCAVLVLASGCAAPAVNIVAPVVPPPTLPSAVPHAGVPLDAQQEASISAILARMSVEEKVAQIIQPDISSITPEQVRQDKFGSILAGGNSSPAGNVDAGWR